MALLSVKELCGDSTTKPLNYICIWFRSRKSLSRQVVSHISGSFSHFFWTPKGGRARIVHETKNHFITSQIVKSWPSIPTWPNNDIKALGHWEEFTNSRSLTHFSSLTVHSPNFYLRSSQLRMTGWQSINKLWDIPTSLVHPKFEEKTTKLPRKKPTGSTWVRWPLQKSFKSSNH